MTMPPGTMHFTLRPLRAGDETALSRFYAGLSEPSRYVYEPFKDTSAEAFRAVVARAVDGTDLSLIALDPEGNIFAHFFIGAVAHETPHLGIGLSDRYQNSGLGRVFLTHLISMARHVLKKQAIGLTVMKENGRAYNLYSKLGFRVVGEVSFRSENDSYEMRLEIKGRDNDSSMGKRTSRSGILKRNSSIRVAQENK